jgi:hypothetical protein
MSPSQILSFFVDNFPYDVQPLDLWYDFSSYSGLADAFINKNPNRSGHGYGFVRVNEKQNILSPANQQ